MRVLVVCAHDDDEVIACGGIIRKLADRGAEVVTMIFAVGNEGYQRLKMRDTIVARRVRERGKAQAILGTSRYITDQYRDFANLDGEDVYRKIMRAVREVRPHLVFGHLPTDYLAHRTLAKVTPEAVWQASWVCSLDLGKPWTVNRLYLFPILELLPKPSHVVDISDTFDAKLAALRAYASQHVVVPGLLDQVKAKARVYGSLIGVKYGEAFMRSQAIPIPVANATDLAQSVV